MRETQYPVGDIVKEIDREGSLYRAIFADVARCAGLKEVVEPRIGAADIGCVFRQHPLDGWEVEGGDDLAVLVAVSGKDRAVRRSEVGGGVVVDEEVKPWLVECGYTPTIVADSGAVFHAS